MRHRVQKRETNDQLQARQSCGCNLIIACSLFLLLSRTFQREHDSVVDVR